MCVLHVLRNHFTTRPEREHSTNIRVAKNRGGGGNRHDGTNGPRTAEQEGSGTPEEVSYCISLEHRMFRSHLFSPFTSLSYRFMPIHLLG